jgi:hypothetical protein
VAPTVASADRRSFTLLLHGSLAASGADARTTLVQLLYRDLRYSPVGSVLAAGGGEGGGTDGGVRAAIAHLVADAGAWQPLAECNVRQRTFGDASMAAGPPGGTAHGTSTAAQRLGAWAAAVSACELDTAGPRGVATLVHASRRLFVFDMEEDEEEEEASDDADADADADEDGGGALESDDEVSDAAAAAAHAAGRGASGGNDGSRADASSASGVDSANE